MINSSFYFSKIKPDYEELNILKKLKEYSNTSEQNVYVLDKPLSLNIERDYNYNKALIVLIPGHKICFIDLDNNEEFFNNYIEDVEDDISTLSNNYDYIQVIGRPREWKSKLIYKNNIKALQEVNFTDWLEEIQIKDLNSIRHSELIISLLIGSINNIQKVGKNVPQNYLDFVKQNIVLFDGDQSRFVYSSQLNEKRITIQGLAGTGKTELLLHKLKNIYNSGDNLKIVFTCYNKVLANDMKKRIPSFFNYMKVNKQIEWNYRLWVMPSWGKKNEQNSGLYSFICQKYNLTFFGFGQIGSFDNACKRAIEELNQKPFRPCFDYILIDESQDFPQSFFDLCEMITTKTLFIAGDIFQNLYDSSIIQSVESHYLLNKCYRTDPRTLIAAHAIGMGLLEKPLIRWLTDEQWEKCGYIKKQIDNNTLSLSRKPVRRFDKQNENNDGGLVLVKTDINNLIEKVINIIKELKNKYPTLKPDDIGIGFPEGSNLSYQCADILQMNIRKEFGWQTIKGYESKERTQDCVFISNKNNIKGLEFPFLICIVFNELKKTISFRNSIFMMLTRSFISSFLIFNDNEFEKIYKLPIEELNKNHVLLLSKPTSEEIDNQLFKIQIKEDNSSKTIETLVEECASKYDYNISIESKNKVKKEISEIVEKDTFSEKDIIEKIDLLFKVYR